MKTRRWSTVIGGALAINLLFAGSALAFDCFNASRPPPAWEVGEPPVFEGRWVWLPSVGVPIEAWGFGVPENFQNGEGSFLLSGSSACGNENRQTEHGIQAGECLGVGH